MIKLIFKIPFKLFSIPIEMIIRQKGLLRTFRFIYKSNFINYCLVIIVFISSWLLSGYLLFLLKYEIDKTYLIYPHIITIPVTLLIIIYILLVHGKRTYITKYINALVEYFNQDSESLEKSITYIKNILIILSIAKYPDDVSVIIIKEYNDNFLTVYKQFGICQELENHKFPKRSIAGYSLKLKRAIMEKNIEENPHIDHTYKDKLPDPDKHIKSMLSIPIISTQNFKKGCVIEFISPEEGIFIGTELVEQFIEIIKNDINLHKLIFS